MLLDAIIAALSLLPPLLSFCRYVVFFFFFFRYFRHTPRSLRLCCRLCHDAMLMLMRVFAAAPRRLMLPLPLRFSFTLLPPLYDEDKAIHGAQFYATLRLFFAIIADAMPSITLIIFFSPRFRLISLPP